MGFGGVGARARGGCLFSVKGGLVSWRGARGRRSRGRAAAGRIVLATEGHPQGAPLGELPGVVGDVVFGAEVEDVLFVLVVFPVGVECVDADSFDGGQVVDFDAFAGEGVEAEIDGGLRAAGMFGGELGEAGNPGAEAGFAVSADVVDLESVLDFTELDGCGGVEDYAVGRERLDELVFGESLFQLSLCVLGAGAGGG